MTLSAPLRYSEPFKFNDNYHITELWKNRQITNFDYLMSLNILAGRSNNDLNQYFVFPWVRANYQTIKIKKGENKFRDF